MPIDKILEEWIGEERKKVIPNMLQEDKVFDEHGMDGVKGYNQALTDLKSRIPELEEMIKEVYYCEDHSKCKSPTCPQFPDADILNIQKEDDIKNHTQRR